MKNNIVVSLGQLRNSFLNSADNQISLIGKLASLTPSTESIEEQCVTMGNGMVYKIATKMSPANVKQLVVSTYSEDDEAFYFHQVVDITNDGLDLDYKLDNVGCTVYDLIADLQSTEHFNTIIGEVSKMFMTRPKVSVSAIDSFISKNMGAADETLSQFRDLLLINAPSGEVSQYTFLSIVKDIMDNGKEEVESGSLKLNENKPSFVANAIATVITTVIESIMQVFSYVLSAIGGVIGIVASVLTNVVSTIIKNISNKVNTEIKVNADEALNIFEAPIFAVSDDFLQVSSGTDYWWKVEGLEKDSAKVFSMGGLTLYLWALSDSHGIHGWNANGFLSLDLHPKRTLDWLITVLNPVITGSYGIGASVSWTPTVSQIVFPDDVYYTADEIASLVASGGDNLMMATMFNLSMIGLRLLQFEVNAQYSYPLQDGWRSIAVDEDRLKGNGGYIQAVTIAKHFIAAHKAGMDLLSFANEYGNATGSNITDLAISIFTFETKRASNRKSSDVPNAWYDAWYTQQGLFSNQTVKMYHSSLHGLLAVPVASTQTIGFNQSISADVVTNSIPTTGMFGFVNAKWQHVVAALAIVGAVSAAVMIASAVGRAKYKKWSMKKSLNLASDLQLARAKYINSSGQIVGSDADYNAFYKQIKRYNRWGKLLGYGSYDPMNNWTNAPGVAESTSIPSGSITPVSSAISDLTDDGRLNLSSMKNEINSNTDNSINASIRRVITLITGEI